MEKFAFIDLHIHTAYSHEDGCDITVPELLDTLQAMAEKKNGKVCFAISDHENIFGSIEAYNLIKQNPKKYDRLNFIPGIECNTSLKSLGLNNEGYATFRKCHMLGYGYDINNKNMQAFSILMHKLIYREEDGKRVNVGRILLYAKKQIEQQYNVKFSYEEIANCITKDNYQTIRSNFVNYMSIKLHKSISEIEGFITPYYPIENAYSEEAQTHSKQDIVDLVDMIKSAGGKISIAHPRSVRYKNNEHSNRVECFKDFITRLQKVTNNGIDGLEMFHSENTDKDFFEMLYNTVKKYDMFITSGSDYHGGKLHSSKVLSKCLNYTFEFCSLTKEEIELHKRDVYNLVRRLPFVEQMLYGKYDGSKQDFVFENIEHGELSIEQILKIMDKIPSRNKKEYDAFIENYTNAKQEYVSNQPKNIKKETTVKHKHHKNHGRNHGKNHGEVEEKYEALPPIIDVEETKQKTKKYVEKKSYVYDENIKKLKTKKQSNTKKQQNVKTDDTLYL